MVTLQECGCRQSSGSSEQAVLRVSAAASFQSVSLSHVEPSCLNKEENGQGRHHWWREVQEYANRLSLIQLFQGLVPIVHCHCNHKCANSTGRVQSHVNSKGDTTYETPPFQYCYHTSDYSVQCAIGHFIIPNRDHPKFSKGVGNLIFSALVALGVRSKTSKFEDQSMFRLINRSQTFTFLIH